jgi:hypothetical protein
MCFFAHLEIPHRSADIDNAGDSAANVAREYVVEMRLDPDDFVFVGTNTVEIGAVGPRKQIARLKEVNVGVDETRQNEFADARNLFSERHRILFAHRDPFDLVAVDHNRCVRHHFAVRRVNYSRSDKRNFFGVCCNRAKKKEKSDNRFHMKAL